jgi:hypothetical protein
MTPRRAAFSWKGSDVRAVVQNADFDIYIPSFILCETQHPILESRRNCAERTSPSAENEAFNVYPRIVLAETLISETVMRYGGWSNTITQNDARRSC